MRTPTAYHHCLRDEDRSLDIRFDASRRDPLPGAGLEDFVLPVGNTQKSRFVDVTDVAGVQPAVDDRRRRRLRIAIVALHDVASANEDLAIVGDSNVHAADRTSDRAVFVLREFAYRRHRRGFRLAVTLHDRNAQAKENHGRIEVERSASTGEKFDAIEA